MTKAIILLLGVAVSGCTTASTRMLGEDTALISARDLSTDSPSAVRKKALVTAAKLARASGYDYFGVVSRNDAVKLNVGEMASGPIGERGATFYGIPVRDIGTDLTVRFLREDQLPGNRDGIYAASAILEEQR